MVKIGKFIGKLWGQKATLKPMENLLKPTPIRNTGGTFIPRTGTLRAKSVPTQEYINKSFTIDFSRMDAVNKDGGFYDRRQVADALAGFTKGEKIKPVVTRSENTADVINRINNIDTIDALRRAEITGELTPQMLAKRQDMVAALESGNIVDRSYAIALEKLEKYAKLAKIPYSELLKEPSNIDKILDGFKKFKYINNKH